MPLHFDILSADGKFLKEAEPALPYEPRYIKNYHFGELSSIICGQCLETDFAGILHLVQDPEIITAVATGEDVGTFLGDETATLPIYPDADPMVLPFTTRQGYMGKVALRHSFPDSPIVYN